MVATPGVRNEVQVEPAFAPADIETGHLVLSGYATSAVAASLRALALLTALQGRLEIRPNETGQ
ncbi:MAG TPA: hypothetical protein VGA42_02435 [Gemmatimonadales bacterium]